MLGYITNLTTLEVATMPELGQRSWMLQRQWRSSWSVLWRGGQVGAMTIEIDYGYVHHGWLTDVVMKD